MVTQEGCGPEKVISTKTALLFHFQYSDTENVEVQRHKLEESKRIRKQSKKFFLDFTYMCINIHTYTKINPRVCSKELKLLLLLKIRTKKM